MCFQPIDIKTWARKEFYNHFTTQVVCSYSLTVNLDVTALQGEKLYPVMLFLLTQQVNETKEFRTALRPEGVGYYETMHPSYTIFNKKNKNFSVIWTEMQKEYPQFLQQYEADVAQYSTSTALAPKAGKPANTFDVSMLPWTAFTAFNLNVDNTEPYLLPIFTMGKLNPENNTLPLAIQVHHAACDGYHVGLFVDGLQEKINRWNKGDA